VGRFSLSHTLRRMFSSKLARNDLIIPNYGFFSQSNWKYLALYSSAYRERFWLFRHFIDP
jgi:hypothetical protein